MFFKPEWLAPVRVKQGEQRMPLAIVHPDVLKDLLLHRRHASLAEFSNIIVREEMLSSPTAVFKGLNRPLHSMGVDNFVFVYVMKPKFTYIYSKPKSSADVLLAPKHSVFVTYLTLARHMMQDVQQAIGAPPDAFRGIILGWEWVPECPLGAGLPNDHAKRYKRRVSI